VRVPDTRSRGEKIFDRLIVALVLAGLALSLYMWIGGHKDRVLTIAADLLTVGVLVLGRVARRRYGPRPMATVSPEQVRDL